MRDNDPVLQATHTRRLGLDEHLHRAGVQRPPTTATLAAVIAPATTAAHTTPPPSSTRWSRTHDQQPRLLEPDPFDDHPLHAQQGAEYPHVANAVLRSLGD
jgi:hypothetical protein